MKKMLVAIACALPFGTVLADEASPLPVIDSTGIVQMSEIELDTVRGEGWGDYCLFCYANNTAIVTQLNLSVASLGVAQHNSSQVYQNNN